MEKLISKAIPVFCVVLISGCATQKELYYWGEYEDLIYDSYVRPGSADPLTQIEKLTADIQKAEANGQKVPPGIFAHLGYLYAVEGNESLSREAFEREKELYPESTVFIQGLLDRASGKEGG